MKIGSKDSVSAQPLIMSRIIRVTVLVYESGNTDKRSGAQESAESVLGNDDGHNKFDRLKTDIFISKSCAISINRAKFKFELKLTSKVQFSRSTSD